MSYQVPNRADRINSHVVDRSDLIIALFVSSIIMASNNTNLNLDSKLSATACSILMDETRTLLLETAVSLAKLSSSSVLGLSGVLQLGLVTTNKCSVIGLVQEYADIKLVPMA